MPYQVHTFAARQSIPFLSVLAQRWKLPDTTSESVSTSALNTTATAAKSATSSSTK